jgi:hypothetical protein
MASLKKVGLASRQLLARATRNFNYLISNELKNSSGRLATRQKTFLFSFKVQGRGARLGAANVGALPSYRPLGGAGQRLRAGASGARAC